MTEYSEITVKIWGKGIVERRRVLGSEVNGRRYVAAPGNFILSRIDARHGAMGIVPESLDGALVTNDFPLFFANTERLDLPFLGWLCRTRDFVELCTRASEGSTNRVRLKEERFLSLEIPLPPLSEQRRIVARIEALAAEINEAKRLRREAEEEAGAMLGSHSERIFSEISERYPVTEFSSLSPHVTSGPRNWSRHYDETGLRFYRAQDVGPSGFVLDDGKIFISPPPGEQGRSAMLSVGDLMLVITGATVGRVNVFREGLASGFVSQHVAICRLPADRVDSEYALWGLRSPLGKNNSLGNDMGRENRV